MPEIITVDRIHAVADAIAAEGDRPTLEAVRTEIGGGSYTTISKAMKAWRAKQAQRGVTAQEVELPEAVAEIAADGVQELRRMITRIWSVAADAAAERLASERQAAADQVDEAQAELDDATTEIRRLESELEVMRDGRDTLAADLARAQGDLLESAKSAEVTQAELRTQLQAATDRLDDAKANAQRQDDTIEDLRRRLDAATQKPEKQR